MATQYSLTNTFTTITEESGTIQNVGYDSVELVSASNATAGEGIILMPGEKQAFNGAIKARSLGETNNINVVDFKEEEEGGDIMIGATASTDGVAGLAPAPTAGQENRFLRGDGTWAVPTDEDTQYQPATQSTDGLMSAADKAKLDGIAAQANKYSLPTASSSVLGGVKIGSNINISSGTISVSNMTGATADDAGMVGLVPAPGAGKQAQFLRGDGAWATPTNTTYSDFVKSGSTAAHGLVPKPPTTAGTTKYLREDGTWTVPPDNNTTYSDFVKSGSTAAAGLVPKPPTAAGTTHYLREDGTWAVPPDNNTTYSNFTKATADAAGKAGLVPAPGAGKQAQFLRGDATWGYPGQIATARAIDGVKFNGSAAISHYGTCDTLAATAAKEVACTGFTLVTGSRIIVKFNFTNTAANPTLNVNSTGAKSIKYKNTNIPAQVLEANKVYEFVYTGSSYEIVGQVETVGNTYFADCVTQASTATKVVEIYQADPNVIPFALVDGVRVLVFFTSSNSASNVNLNVAGTGAKLVKPSQPNIVAQHTYEFVYFDGEWRFLG